MYIHTIYHSTLYSYKLLPVLSIQGYDLLCADVRCIPSSLVYEYDVLGILVQGTSTAIVALLYSVAVYIIEY